MRKKEKHCVKIESTTVLLDVKAIKTGFSTGF